MILRGLQVRSLHKAARLRIEIELLDRPPKRPIELKFDNKKDFHDATLEWKNEKKQWKDRIRRRMSAIAKEEEKERTIDVETCSALLRDNDIARYFNAYRGAEKSFLSKVTINSGFVAPLHLLTGVMTFYEQHWQPVVNAYGQSVIHPGDDFREKQARKMQSFIFDCWLLWGPSIPICICPQWQGEVALQYGYGDEDNSLALRCSSPEIFRTLLGQNDGGHDGLALRARVSGVLKWGPDLSTVGLCPAQDAIAQRSDERLVLDISGGAGGIRPAGGTSEQVKAQYYSAYLWIAFVMCKADPDTHEPKPLNPENKWRDLIPFFIHANIADPVAYEFHARQLAREAVEAAIQLLEDEQDLILRFACAIDETGCGHDSPYVLPVSPTEKISAIMRRFADEAKRQGHGSALRRLEFASKEPFEHGDYASCALPQIVKRFYEDIDAKGLEFRELRYTRKSDLDLLRIFYDDCFEPEFPDENERESREEIENYLRAKEFGWYEKNNYHVILMLDKDDELLGGAIADYLNEPNAGVIEYIVIKPEHRNAGLGSQLLECVERVLHDDADKAQNRPLDWIAAEIDDPFVTPRPLQGVDPFAVARKWGKWGYRLLDFPYRQPALAETKKPVDTMFLSAKLCHGGKFQPKHSDKKFLPKSDIESLLIAYLRLAMRIDDPQHHEDFQAMHNSMPDEVPLVDLEKYLGPEDGLVDAKEVIGAQDPELVRALELYNNVFGREIGKDDYWKVSRPPDGLTDRIECRDHLWTIRSAAEAQCEGVASFVTLPNAGFVRYIEFHDRWPDSDMLRGLIARIEERMVRDAIRSGKQMKRDGEQMIRHGKRLGRSGKKKTVELGEEMRDAGTKKLEDDKKKGLNGAGARGWYIECADPTRQDLLLDTGFWELDLEYPLPPPPARPIRLMYKPFGRVYDPPTINSKVLLQVVREIDESAYGTPKPDVGKLEKCLQGDFEIKAKSKRENGES
ncbi:hypothetical protein BST39_02135 [Mycobacterium paraseoulense]|uniref:N-acetyltransferase domain-containing protein n=1 Tax=Mycobacterium paraseoulense TaxID=590652 RepID=A0A1X0IGJ9_9MYCO|nr:hypothetical protein BST39_02135 [Mycobacterium paraseoulense]